VLGKLAERGVDPREIGRAGGVGAKERLPDLAEA
jgi:hypothetical protein